jgi:hypothetical protein
MYTRRGIRQTVLFQVVEGCTTGAIVLFFLSPLLPSLAPNDRIPLTFLSATTPAPPFAMSMNAPTIPPDDILRAYAAKHASTATATLSPLSGTTAGTEVVPSLRGTGMRVLYKQPEDGVPSAGGNANGGNMIRAGPGARLSR